MNYRAKIFWACAFFLLPVLCRGQFSVETLIPSGGGGTSGGGVFSVTGGIGQTDPLVSTGAGYNLETVSLGFLVAPPPSLSITLTNGFALLSWPASLAGWRLEVGVNPGADSSGWSLVPPPYAVSGVHYIFIDPISLQAKYYRLRRDP